MRYITKTVFLVASIGFSATFCQGAVAQSTVTEFSVDLSPEGVLVPELGEVSTGAFGQATLVLTETVGEEPVLDYTIELFNINPDSLTSQVGDLPSTNGANLAAIHFHTVDRDTEVLRGSPHVLNVFGPPLNLLNLPQNPGDPLEAREFLHPTELAEDDYEASFDAETGAAVVTGRWDLTDVFANDVGGEDALGNRGESKPLEDFLDQLFGEPSVGNQQIGIVIHTNVFPAGEFGGFVSAVPEPTSLAMLLIAGSLATLRRNRV